MATTKATGQWFLAWNYGEDTVAILAARGEMAECDLNERSHAPFDIGLDTREIENAPGLWVFEGDHMAAAPSEPESDYECWYEGKWRRPMPDELKQHGMQ